VKRGTFKRPVMERRITVHTPGTGRGVVLPASSAVVAVPKEDPVRCESYRRYVAAMPCWLCGVHGRSQAAHSDEGKGAHIKAGDDRTFPLCAASPGQPGCHYQMGTAGTYTREVRRRMERQAVAFTQHLLIERSAGDPKLRAALIEARVLVPIDTKEVK
jgi:hypothetical protein